MRLEAVIVGRVADRAGAPRQRFKLGEVFLALGMQRLFDEHVLAVF